MNVCCVCALFTLLSTFLLSLSRFSVPALFGGLIMFTQLLSEISSIGLKKKRERLKIDRLKIKRAIRVIDWFELLFYPSFCVNMYR